MCFFLLRRNKILVYNPNKTHKSQSLFYLTTALYVSGVTITHLQEHKTTVTTSSGNRYTVLLSAVIVEELERNKISSDEEGPIRNDLQSIYVVSRHHLL